MAALQRALEKTGMVADKVDFLARATKVVLETNVLEWVGKLWLQVFGTAIGTPLAPDYSGLFMGELETKAFLEWSRLHPNSEEQLQFFKRMIDDGFGIWTGPIELLYEFLPFMNTYHSLWRSPACQTAREQKTTNVARG